MYKLYRPKGPMDVFVYRNLQNGMWSVRSTAGPNYGRVIFHAAYVKLVHAHTKVSESGRQRVLRENRKNVHAGIDGRMVYLVSPYEPRYSEHDWKSEDYDGLHMTSSGRVDSGMEVTYNPYKGPHFVYRVTRRRADIHVGTYILYEDGKVFEHFS